MDPEYLQQKERRTVRSDKRDIQPHCVVMVSVSVILVHFTYYHVHCRKFGEDIPVLTGYIEVTCPH